MIILDNIRYRTLAIENLQIAPGITSVIGPNGSGKTTLLKLLAGIAIPESGTILVDGVQPRNIENAWVNEFPDPNIQFASTNEEIASPLRFRHVCCTVIDERVESVMESVGIRYLMGRDMQEISGGEKVLVALAAALVFRPQVLVLDEYDSHLDARRAAEIAQVIRKSSTPYVIHCTQDMEAAASGDAVIFLKGGKVSCTGAPKEVFASLAGTAYYPLSWKCRE
jgi:energy-coupling factor transport system ATP-binding protein